MSSGKLWRIVANCGESSGSLARGRRRRPCVVWTSAVSWGTSAMAQYRTLPTPSNRERFRAISLDPRKRDFAGIGAYEADGLVGMMDIR